MAEVIISGIPNIHYHDYWGKMNNIFFLLTYYNEGTPICVQSDAAVMFGKTHLFKFTF